MPRSGIKIGWGNRTLTPTAIANLAGWYYVSSADNLLKSNGTPVSQIGDAVALFADSSYNSETKCLCSNGVTNNSSYAATGSNIGTGDFTFAVDFRCSVSASNGSIAGFRATIPDNTSPGAAFEISHQFRTPANLAVAIYGTTGNDFRYYRFVNYFSTNLGQRKTITVTRSVNTVKVYSDGVELTPDAEVTGGTPPAWGATVNTTYTVGGTINTSIAANDSIFRLRVYNSALSAADVLLDYQTGAAGSRLVDVNYSLQSKLTTSFTASTGQTVTIATSGDLGMRISGERDLVQFTSSKQPIYLPWSGTNYGWQPSAGSSYFSTPDSIAVSLTTEFDYVARVRYVDYTPSTTVAVGSKWDGGSQKSFICEINASTGRMNVGLTTNGTTDINKTSTVSPPLSDNTIYWLRYTFKGNNGASGYDVAFYYAADTGNNTPPSVWTQVGTTVTTAGAITLWDGTATFNVGAFGTGSEQANGVTFYAELRSTIGGSPVAIFNPALYTSGTTFTASTGEVWTLNGRSIIVVRTCLYGDGSDDYMKCSNYSLNNESVYIVAQQVSWISSGTIFSGSQTDGWLMQASPSPQVNFRDATNNSSGITSWQIGEGAIITCIKNATVGSVRKNRENPVFGNLSTAAPNGLTLFARANGSANWGNAAISEVVVYSEVQNFSLQSWIINFLASKWAGVISG